MAIITFWNDGKVETNQSMTIAAIATNIAIDYDYKILIINTKFDDHSLERAFESKNTINNIFSKGKVDVDMGLSGAAKAIISNKTSPEIITNYTRIILKMSPPVRFILLGQDLRLKQMFLQLCRLL